MQFEIAVMIKLKTDMYVLNLKACHPEPQRRYRSAYDFKRALETWERENSADSPKGNTIIVNPWSSENKIASKPEKIIKQDTKVSDKRRHTVRRVNDKVVNGILVGLCVILCLSIISGIWYIYTYYKKPAAPKKSEKAQVSAVQQVEQDNTEEAQQPEENKFVLANYFGRTKNDILRYDRLTDISRFVAVYTDKNVKVNEVCEQFPAWGTEIDPARDRVSFYYSKGDLTNDQGYRIKTDRKELHLKKESAAV